MLVCNSLQMNILNSFSTGISWHLFHRSVRRTLPSAGASHPPATLRATPALLGAATHHVVVRQSLAVLGATGADLGAHPAGSLVQLRPAQHEVGARGADLPAVRQQPDVT